MQHVTGPGTSGPEVPARSTAARHRLVIRPAPQMRLAGRAGLLIQVARRLLHVSRLVRTAMARFSL